MRIGILDVLDNENLMKRRHEQHCFDDKHSIHRLNKTLSWDVYMCPFDVNGVVASLRRFATFPEVTYQSPVHLAHIQGDQKSTDAIVSGHCSSDLYDLLFSE